MSYKLLITGSSGFIGRYVVKEPLLKKFELLTPSSKELNLMNPKSVSKYIEKNKPDYLIHLAWITNPGIYKSSLENIKWTNASGHLFREFYRVNGLKLVAAGTQLEYDQKSEFFMEDVTPISPNTLYGTSKVHTQQMLKFSQRTYTWARIFTVYGIGEPQSKLVTNTITSLIENKPVTINSPDSIIDCVYVKDVSRILSSLISDGKGYGGKELNICSGQPTSIREIVEYIGKSLDREKYISYKSENPVVTVGNNFKLTNMGFDLKYSWKMGIDEMIKSMVD